MFRIGWRFFYWVREALVPKIAAAEQDRATIHVFAEHTKFLQYINLAQINRRRESVVGVAVGLGLPKGDLPAILGRTF